LLFFALGVGLKVEKISTKTWVFLLAGLMLFGLNVALFYFHDGVSDLNREVISVCMNLSLLVVVFRWIQMDRLPNWQPLEWLGQQSLGIYLWHVLSIFWLKELVGTRDLFRYYAWVGFAQIVLVFIIYLGWRYWRGSRYILGER
jgi:peptidoglycan/LPS O-acetylase OafA/YrhL